MTEPQANGTGGSELNSKAAATGDGEPQFGLLEVVEAFTAMRHEWRGQTRESRQLAEQIGSLRTLLEQALARPPMLTASGGDAASTGGSSQPRELARLLADLEHQLTRACEGIEQSERHANTQAGQRLEAVRRFHQNLNPLARWLARPLLEFCFQTLSPDPVNSNSAATGVSLLLARYRQSLRDLEIKRVDSVGQPFDGTWMQAIGSVATTEHPPGHVAEQVSPCYLWKGTPLRFAEVRVARSNQTEVA